MKTQKNRKIFILDTSVLVYDADAFRFFIDSNVVIPLIVLEELDKVKKLSNESGKNARVAIRYLDEISNTGEIHKGITIENNICIKIDTLETVHIGTDPSYGDNQLLGCAKRIQTDNMDGDVILVSRDINLRVRARAMGISAEDYTQDRNDSADLYPGVQYIQDEDMGAALVSYGELLEEEYPLVGTLYPNECVIITAANGQVIAAGRKVKNFLKIVGEREPWGLLSRSAEQKLAIDMIMDARLPLVSLIGLAGGGKSLVSIACGLELVLNQRKFSTFSIYRPIQSMGNEIGFVPGTIEEKLNPWFSSIDDAFQFLLEGNSGKGKSGKDTWKDKLYQFTSNGTIQKEALSYIRGRSISNSLILVDECQNLSKEEVKTIITRVGQGSKIILTGDVSQIDNPKLDATSNGLSYLIDKFQQSNLSGHITFSKGERSALATEAAELL
jgi:PhoH-like ATPase